MIGVIYVESQKEEVSVDRNVLLTLGPWFQNYSKTRKTRTTIIMVEDGTQRIIYHAHSRNHQANEFEKLYLTFALHPSILPTSFFFFTDKSFLEK